MIFRIRECSAACLARKCNACWFYVDINAPCYLLHSCSLITNTCICRQHSTVYRLPAITVCHAVQYLRHNSYATVQHYFAIITCASVWNKQQVEGEVGVSLLHSSHSRGSGGGSHASLSAIATNISLAGGPCTIILLPHRTSSPSCYYICYISVYHLNYLHLNLETIGKHGYNIICSVVVKTDIMTHHDHTERNERNENRHSWTNGLD